MIALTELIKPLRVKSTVGDVSQVIRRIDFDSRRVTEGSLFVATRGLKTDGHRFIDQALEAGASAVVCEEVPEIKKESVTYIQVPNGQEALAFVADTFFNHPSQKLKLIGVTGTNGKTTVATLLYQLFSILGTKVGLLSTVENKIGEESIQAEYTTPDAVTLNSLLDNMVSAGCTLCFMEVSSHAIDQHRVDALHFAGGVFTNMSHDHLDYHKTFDNYIAAKKKFFDQLPAGSFALVNIDDKRGRVMVQNTKAEVFEYSLSTLTDFKAKVIENSLTGLHLEINEDELFSRLIGKFNAYNLLAVFGVGTVLDVEKVELLTAISKLRPAEGRFDIVLARDSKLTAIVDYSHTPDALKKALETLQETRPVKARIITVVGCGGDRDRTKRPLMASIGALLSDQLILTSDNPRSEEPGEILEEMLEGLTPGQNKDALVIEDRAQAIKMACKLAKEGDIIYVAGKGHEKYQEIKGKKIPFDDKAELMASLNLN
ncbi:MAG: UDP-N-acetylmuramoyl-L-alanyl-D-glutamate--2,6-diaminopimelate ligase [Saprospiraceae bacterium]|nr:UDP-N-acetylmuramoyl-L-alanyl-D-glutamate--2,6-diaminopimelate ligase [Saprospiraceae bacterium]